MTAVAFHDLVAHDVKFVNGFLSLPIRVEYFADEEVVDVQMFIGSLRTLPVVICSIELFEELFFSL